MGNKGLLKRMLPFLATFAVGIFIASFFVSFGGSRFGFKERRMRHFQEMQQLRMENEELREENLRLKGIRNLNGDLNFEDEDFNVPHSGKHRLTPPPKAMTKARG